MIKKLKEKLFKPKAQQETEYLGKEKIWKLLRIQSYPAIIGQVVMALYNFVDTMFVGKVVGMEGIAAVSIVMPVYLIISSFALSLGIGASSIISRALGEKQFEKVHATFGVSQLCILLSTVLIVAACLIFKDPLLYLFGATADVWELSSTYYTIVVLGQIFVGFMFANTAIIRAIGDTKAVMIINISGCLLNVVLDYLFMFPLWRGIAGAAWATVISRIRSALYCVGYLLRQQKVIQISFRYFKFQRETLKDIFLLGIPTFFRQVIGSVLMILVNNLLRYHGGTAAISVFGMTQRILMLFMMPLFGLTQGLAPIIGYNYGAKKFHRVYEVLRLAVKIVTGFGLLISLIYLIYPTFLVPLFTQSSQEVQASKLAVLLQMSSFFLIGFQITIGTYYQSVGQYKKAFILSFLRQAFVFIPLVVCFAWLWSLLGIWRSFPVTDVIAAVITIWICRKDWQNLRKLAHNSRAEVPLQGTIG